MLNQTQQAVQNTAEAIAAVLRLDVTVVDSSLVRLAGTGPYRQRVGARLHPDTAFGQALQTGQTVTVSNPRNDTVCAQCRVRPDCRETAHIAHPILSRDGVIGVIGLVAFNEAQKDWLLSQHAAHSEFIAKMSDLLAAKLLEERMMAEVLEAKSNLDAVVNAVQEGIVAVDASGAIRLVNAAARHLLGTDEPEVLAVQFSQLAAEVFQTGEGFTGLERQFRTARGPVALMTTAAPIRSQGGLLGAVFTLQDMRDVHDLVYRLSVGEPEFPLDQIIGQSPVLVSAVSQARQAARGSATVLITGESGTGKELFARGIHAASPRRKQPFIAINCAAIPEELLESELFGYAEGAFTGARKGGKPGKFELANRGTLFLDEIGDMSLRLQAKLLRVLQEGEVSRVGATETRKLDVRIIAATHRDLEASMRKAEFREDLFYRISVIPIEVPPLRRRKEDLPLLIAHFCSRYEGRPVTFTQAAIAALTAYDWPGNVRELKNAVEYAVHMATTFPIPAECLPKRLSEASPKPETAGLRSLEAVERDLLKHGLELYGPTEAGKIRLAETLGISRATVYRKLRQYGLVSK